MPTYHCDIEQGTPEWYAARAGAWSASKAAIIMGGLDTSGLASLIKDIAWERVYGPLGDTGYKSSAMERGNEVEPQAREWAAFNADEVIERMGLVAHTTIPSVVWSPDGLYAKRKRGIEAKSPLHRAMMDMLRKREVPAEYRHQCRWACWVGELDGLDFVGFHPSTGGIVVPVEITQADRDAMAERVALLETKVAPWVALLNERRAA